MGSGFVSYYTLREAYLKMKRERDALRRAAKAVIAEADEGNAYSSLARLREVVARIR